MAVPLALRSCSSCRYRRPSSSGIPGAPLVGFDVKDPKERKSQYTINATGIIQRGYDRVRDGKYPHVDGTNERVSVQKSNLWRRHCRWYVLLLFLKVKAICLEFALTHPQALSLSCL